MTRPPERTFLHCPNVATSSSGMKRSLRSIGQVSATVFYVEWFIAGHLTRMRFALNKETAWTRWSHARKHPRPVQRILEGPERFVIIKSMESLVLESLLSTLKLVALPMSITSVFSRSFVDTYVATGHVADERCKQDTRRAPHISRALTWIRTLHDSRTETAQVVLSVQNNSLHTIKLNVPHSISSDHNKPCNQRHCELQPNAHSAQPQGRLTESLSHSLLPFVVASHNQGTNPEV